MLPTLFSYKKWKVKKVNLKVGELVMLRYHKQFKDDYFLAKVTEVHPDDYGLVRKVKVSYRKKNPRESAGIYKSKPLLCEQAAIHRLHRLDLADEPAQVPDEEGAVHGQGQADDAASDPV